MNNHILQAAINGATVNVTWAQIGIDYTNNTGFASLADLQNWAATFGLQITENPDKSITIARAN
jgi:hypothetical protein